MEPAQDWCFAHSLTQGIPLHKSHVEIIGATQEGAWKWQKKVAKEVAKIVAKDSKKILQKKGEREGSR